MKRYFKISENFTPNPEYNVDLSVSGFLRQILKLIPINRKEAKVGFGIPASHLPTSYRRRFWKLA